MAYQLPENYADSNCYIVAINAELIPIIAGSLEILQQRHVWETDADYERGYNAIAAVKACLMKTCLNELIESNNRLYRLLTTAIYGQQYTLISVDPLVINPAIPEVPDHTIGTAGLLAQLTILERLVDNGLNGTITGPYIDPRGVKPLLTDILTAMQTNMNDEEILEKLKLVLLALG